MIKFDTDKLSGLFAILSLVGALAASLAMILGAVSPKYGAIALVASNAIALFTKRVQSVLKRGRKMPSKFLGGLLICAFSLSMIGCDKTKIEKSIRTAKEQSAIIKLNTIKIIEANIDAFKAGEITREQLAELNVWTGRLKAGIEVYSTAVKKAEALFKEGKAPEETLDKLAAVFSEEVSSVFFELTEKLKILSPSQSETLKTIVSGIRLAILAIQSAIAEGFEQKRSLESWV